MTRPLRFIHTADWQLGLRVRFIPGDAGAIVRNARLQTIRRIGEVAREQEVEFVVVAGDVFEHHGLKPSTLLQTFDALANYSVPVYLLPGNHDPYSSDSLYQSRRWEKDCPANVHVLGNREPVEVREGVFLLPCPLLARHTLDDPAEHLQPDFGPQEGFRVAVAHGGIREILEALDGAHEVQNAISMKTAARARLDYLALGDWHGYLRIDERTYYPGAPEATRFKEKLPGKVLLVEIDEPGATPRVEQIEVNTLAWLKRSFTLSVADDLSAIEEFVEGLPNKAETLLELHLEGTLEVSLRHRLEEEILAQAGARLCWLRTRDEKLETLIRDEDLEEIAHEGWVQGVISALRGGPPGVNAEEAEAALRLLYRLHKEVNK
ncbi:MAG: DNA repair exonuclease [Planctomycetes bacterium]|nr:DNA repair exonuclease [Planctomycetota bacterium]